MKKRVCLLCCVVGLLLPTTAHGQTVQASQNDLPQVLWVEGHRDIYITQPSSVENFVIYGNSGGKQENWQSLDMGNEIIP